MTARGAVATVVTSLMICTSPVDAQTPAQLQSACVGAGGGSRLCTGAAIAAHAIQGQVGLLAGAGVEVPGTATTLGTRVGGGTRFSVSVRTGLVPMAFPDLSDPFVTDEAGGIASTVQGQVAAGVFEGLQLMPTVGGFLSLDLFGQASLLLVPQGEGLSEGARSYAMGARVGILREGFTVPGVSVSVARRFPGTVAYVADVDAAALELDSGVTAYRATVGKDLFAVEWLAGFGIDEFDGSATIDVTDTVGSGGSVQVSGPVRSDRRLYFGSASTTVGIVLTLSIEAGWAEGFEAVPGWDGPYDPESRTLFGGVSARLTL